MRRSRRKSRYTWMPINPTFIGSEGTDPFTFYFGESDIAPNVGSGPQTLAVPILQDQDQTSGQSDPGISLRDRVEGKDYAVERIVGKVWCSLSQFGADEAGEYTVQQALVGMGIAVLPVDEDDGQPSLTPAEYDVLNSNNSAAPWM